MKAVGTTLQWVGQYFPLNIELFYSEQEASFLSPKKMYFDGYSSVKALVFWDEAKSYEHDVCGKEIWSLHEMLHAKCRCRRTQLSELLSFKNVLTAQFTQIEFYQNG